MAALDFPNAPTVGQIYTPGAGAPTYIWNGTTWSQVGQASYSKISSGVVAAVNAFDIPFPAAAGFPGGFEILLSNVLPQAATDTLVTRHSNDGVVFGSAAQYRYAATIINDGGGSVSFINSTAQTYIALNGTHANTNGYKSGYRLFYPSTENGQSQNVMWDGWYFNGTNVCKINGLGLNTTTAGQGMPWAVRFQTNSGSNFSAGIRWQLNGWK